jgi:hypothetical protein
MVKKTLPFSALIILGLAAGCASRLGVVSSPTEAAPAVEPAVSYLLEDHKALAEGEDLPEWVSQYMNGGIQALENLEEYRDRYVFIAKDTGANLKALGQWAAGFRIVQDFPRLAAARIQDRLTRAAGGNPDVEFGRFFERVIRSSSDAVYTGAVREDDYWVLKRYLQENGETAGPGEYEYYILVSIDRALLQGQITAILDAVVVELPPNREQSSAITRVKEIFYESF